MSDLEPTFSAGEEVAHAVTHGFGLVCAIAWTLTMAEQAHLHGDAIDLFAALVYGGTMTHVYLASTLYHALPMSWQTKRTFELLDYTGIYALIAGTYTPFMLGPLRGPFGWSVFGVVWLVALLGIAQELLSRPRRVRLSLALYLGMGWVGIVIGVPLSMHVPQRGLLILLAGGTAYTVGVIFYAWRAFRYHHAVWHVFVLIGSALHTIAVIEYAIPYPH